MLKASLTGNMIVKLLINVKNIFHTIKDRTSATFRNTDWKIPIDIKTLLFVKLPNIISWFWDDLNHLEAIKIIFRTLDAKYFDWTNPTFPLKKTHIILYIYTYVIKILDNIFLKLLCVWEYYEIISIVVRSEGVGRL